MDYIEYKDAHGTYRIERPEGPLELPMVLEDMVIPILLAAGFGQDLIDEYFVKV